MHEMKEKLIKAGTDILNASKTELYVSMQFSGYCTKQSGL